METLSIKIKKHTLPILSKKIRIKSLKVYKNLKINSKPTIVLAKDFMTNQPKSRPKWVAAARNQRKELRD